MELFKTVPAYFTAIYLLVQVLKFWCKSIKPIEKLSRRHFINLFDVFKVLS